MSFLIRATVFIAGWALSLALVDVLTADSPDASIGAGLLVFAAVALAAGLWGLADGLRLPFGRLAVIWVAVGIALGCAVPFLTAGFDGDFDLQVVLDDLVAFIPFIAGLVAAPALVGGAFGAALGGDRPRSSGRVDPAP